MRAAILVCAVVLLAACAEKLTPEQQAAADEKAIAEVEATQEVAAQPLAPQKILYPDIEKYELFGTSCAFVPEGGGLGAIALAMEDSGYLKLDGEIVRLAADKGSPELPMSARAKYDGKAQSFSLTLDEAAGKQQGIETINYPARLVIRDTVDHTVYEATGIAQCGS